jgi:hypothetical protein
LHIFGILFMGLSQMAQGFHMSRFYSGYGLADAGGEASQCWTASRWTHGAFCTAPLSAPVYH